MRGRKKLTNLEMETLHLLLSGKTNKQIAAEMGTEEQCVKNRLRSALHKIGLQHSRQVIPIAARLTEMLESGSATFHVTQT